MNCQILFAKAEDHLRLTEIALAAKAYWNYPQEYLTLWKDDLTISPSYIANHELFKLINTQGEILGFAALEQEIKNMDINHLWIDPKYIGQGFGRQLIERVFELAQHKSIHKITVTSDPNATSFYEKFGFITVREIESLPKGRFLPQMEKIMV